MQIRQSRAFASTEEVSPAGRACQAAISRSFSAASLAAFPYPHLALTEVLPSDVAWALARLPLAQPKAAVLGCPRPAAQAYHDLGALDLARFPACRTVVEGFGSEEVVAAIARVAGANLRDCQVQISLVREVDGYERPPVTRCGDARFTLMVALDTGHQGGLGPDIYFETGDWASQVPWRAGCGFAFVPSPRSWHGFEPRMIRRVRTSLVVDYVSASAALAAPHAGRAA
jgi:hypothetical protein